MFALAVDLETAFLEYLDMFYNLGFAGRAMKKIGAVEFATTLAPGLRDVLLTGKIKECVVRTDKAAARSTTPSSSMRPPPAGSASSSTSPARCRAGEGGPIHSQSQGVVRLCTRSRPSCTW